jgi:hypothetical protein
LERELAALNRVQGPKVHLDETDRRTARKLPASPEPL